jgi:hypothetical protein
MKTRLLRFVFAAAVTAAACQTTHTDGFHAELSTLPPPPPPPPPPRDWVDDEKVTTFPVLRPLPKDWTGSRADLMVTDAVISCSYSGTKPAIIHPEYFQDKYMTYLLGKMSVLRGNNNAGAPPYYPDNAACVVYPDRQDCLDITPLQGKGSDGSSYIQPASMPVLPTGDVGLALGAPQFNLCVAQKLRDFSPGGAVSEALLLSAADQLQLLEVARERAQTAMLQYAALTAAFSPRTAPDAATQASSVTWQLRKWAETNGSSVTAMGRDFATAVQYEITLSRELVRLFASNATARVPTGAQAKASGASMWGEDSWRQRAMSLLYGGDPLRGEATHRPQWWRDDPSSRWNGFEFDGQTGGPATDWPSRYDQGFVGTSTPDPQVVLLERLARQADALNLLVPTRPSPPTSGDVSTLFAACVDNHYYVDRQQTADQMYRSVEAMLRQIRCSAPDSGCDATPASQLPSPATDSGSYILSSSYSITFEHALKLAARLDDQVANLCPYANDQKMLTDYDPRKKSLDFVVYGVGSGSMDVAGALESRASINGVAGTWWHLSANSALVPKRLEELEAPYTGYAPFRIPTQAFDGVAAWQQQIAAASAWRDSRRTIGTVAALQATREAIVAGMLSAGSDAVLGQYQAVAPQTLRAIAGAIGDGGASVTATPTLAGSQLVQSHASDPATGTDAYAWTVTVMASPTDNWFDSQHPEQYTLVATASPIAGRLLLYPGSSTFVSSDPFSVVNLVGKTEPMTWKTGAPAVHVVDSAALSRWEFAANVPAYQTLTLAVKKTVGDSTEYRVLATTVRLAPTFGEVYTPSYVQTPRPFEAQYVAYGGSLNAAAQQLMAPQRENPAMAAYDGLGLPLNLVPVSDPRLMGANATDNPVSIYLARATKAADDAKQAIQTQLDNLFTVAQDEQARALAAQQSDGLIALERQNLCGASVGCDVTSFNYDLHTESAWVTANPGPPNCQNVGATEFQRRSDCAFYGLLQSMNMKVALATPVFNHVADPSPPQLPEYDGGSLQSAFIEEWSAVRGVRNSARSLAAAAASVRGRVDQYAAILQTASERARQNCSQDALNDSVQAGTSTTKGTSYSSDGTITQSESQSYSPGPLIAQTQRCKDVTLELNPAKKQVIWGFLDAMLAATSEASKLGDAERVVREAVAKVQGLSAQTRLAIARDELQRKLADANPSLKTNFGLFNVIGSNAVWTARATVDNARRQAVLARRAIEARYVVDLSQLTADESQVVAPALWADQVYAYDRDSPAALGLDIDSMPAAQIYPYGLQTYVKNLELFVNGFAGTRPTAVALSDTYLVSLPSPLPSATASSSGTIWTFYCPNGGGTWVPFPSSGNLADACGTGVAPLRARISFTLDPWGRLAGTPGLTPSNAYNSRFTKLAVNLTGTSARDCSTQPADCGAYVPYRLVHNGPAFTTSYEATQRTLALPIGVVDNAKAVAKERTMSVYSWTSPPDSELLASVARTEFVDRPLGGTFTLDLNPYLESNIRLDYVTGVQLLFQADSWIRQKDPTARRRLSNTN